MAVGCVVAVDLGGSAAKVGCATAPGELVSPETVPLDAVRALGRAGDEASPERVVDGLAALVRRVVEQPPDGLEPVAVGLAVPGIVDVPAGVGVFSTMLGWRDAPLRDEVAAASGLPVALAHDVSAAAVAEGRVGAARGRRDWLFLAIGTGLGSALVLDGTPYRGSTGWGGELGHVVVDPDGPPCPCGKRGCLEVLASASALPARYADAAPSTAAPPPRTAADVADRARAGDPVAARVWDDATRALGTVLAAACEMLNPELVVIGGGLALSGRQLLDPVADALADQVRFVRPAPPLVPARLGPLAGLHGAALAGLDLAAADGEV